MNASATLVIVRGTILRSTDLRSRHAHMKSGSGYGHDAAPAGHPTPRGRRPAPRHPFRPMPAPPIIGHPQPASRAPAASLRKLRERSAPLDPGQPGAPIRRLSGHGRTPTCPQPPQQTSPKPAQTTKTPAHHLQRLDAPLHMSAHLTRGGGLETSRRRVPGDPAWRSGHPPLRLRGRQDPAQPLLVVVNCSHVHGCDGTMLWPDP